MLTSSLLQRIDIVLKGNKYNALFFIKFLIFAPNAVVKEINRRFSGDYKKGFLKT